MEDLITNLGADALKTTALLASPILISALVVGLIISVLQSITQINEVTLTFVPKMVVVAVVIILAGPWMLDVMSNYTINLFEGIVDFVRN
jgi:flagellar biosynthesis protein FliQ